MKKENHIENFPTEKKEPEKKISLEGYPKFPPKEDIYNTNQRVDNTNTEGGKSLGNMIDEYFGNDTFSDDLDIPASELDDQQERIGNEDDENNYYSIGGDRHDDLEEDKLE